MIQTSMPARMGSWGRIAALAAALAVLVPSGSFAQLPAPSDEPITPIPQAAVSDAKRIRLGAALFDDPRLSGDARRSCASCHDLRTNGATGVGHDTTPEGQPISLNTNTVFNAALSFRLNWSGNARTLEDQAAMSLERPDIMGTSRQQVVDRLRKDPDKAAQFVAAYGHGPDWVSLLDALATFERTLVTPGGRFDQWLGGNHAAITPQEVAGYDLFKSIGCVSCHQGVNVGGNLFEQVGVVNPEGLADRKILRVPSLRNVALTPPYFHDGSAAKLDVAVRKMAAAQLGREMTDAEVGSITAFLGTLNGQYDGHALRAAR